MAAEDLGPQPHPWRRSGIVTSNESPKNNEGMRNVPLFSIPTKNPQLGRSSAQNCQYHVLVCICLTKTPSQPIIN